MDRITPPTDTLDPNDPLSTERPFRLALWGGLALSAGLALARTGANALFDLNATVVAPFWGGLGVVAGILGGAAISIRPWSQLAWLGGAVSAGLLSVGVFGDWDSIQLLFRVGAVVALLVAIMLSLPMKPRLAFFGGCVVLHYLGILSAVTNPNPQPWISGQAWTRVFRPYLHFTYMNNAYQFYSPDPGPARQVWFCVEYTPKEEFVAKYPMPPSEKVPGYFRWIKLPERPEHYTDPLGQAYFRKLSVSEYMAQFPTGFNRNELELSILNERRKSRADIRRFPEAGLAEYLPPTVLVQKAFLPSYARHIASVAQHPEFDIRSIKSYRVTHKILAAPEFRGVNGRPAVDPYDPTTYLVYYQGDFDRDGNLRAPYDPLLFWHLAIRVKPFVEVDTAKLRKLRAKNLQEFLDEYNRCYDDYVSIHAGFDHQNGGNLP